MSNCLDELSRCLGRSVLLQSRSLNELHPFCSVSKQSPVFSDPKNRRETQIYGKNTIKTGESNLLLSPVLRSLSGSPVFRDAPTFVNLIFILYARWRFKIVCLQTELASLAIHKKSNFYRFLTSIFSKRCSLGSQKSNFYGF